jgi:hypothetical protein
VNILSNSSNNKNQSFENTLIKGNSTDLNYYFIDLFFGSKYQKQSLIIDTGSLYTGIPCTSTCSICGRHINSIYNNEGTYLYIII